MILTSIEGELHERGRCMIQTLGISMEPLLHDRYSTVVLERVQRPLQRGDVVLFRRDKDVSAGDFDYVLHRIVKVLPGAYLIRGDNCIAAETVRQEQILGVMMGFFNGGTYTDCEKAPSYRRYVRLLPLRYGLLWLYAFPRRAAGKVKRTLGMGQKSGK